MLESLNLGNIRIWDVLDVVIVFYLVFRIYKLLRGTIAIKIFIGVMILYVAWFVVGKLEMQLLSIMLDKFVGFGVIILVIIFQPEVRQFLLLLGNSTTRSRFTFLNTFFGEKLGKETLNKKNADEISKAVSWLSEHKIGALIVLSDNVLWQNVASSGIAIDGRISFSLLENIFFKNSPLHDGAVIIGGHKILAASCVLPVSNSYKLSAEIGLRHRAAVGVTELHPVMVLVVSEETGEISYAIEGELHRHIPEDQICEIIFKRLCN